jgi:hypothetical protein
MQLSKSVATTEILHKTPALVVLSRQISYDTKQVLKRPAREITLVKFKALVTNLLTIS